MRWGNGGCSPEGHRGDRGGRIPEGGGLSQEGERKLPHDSGRNRRQEIWQRRHGGARDLGRLGGWRQVAGTKWGGGSGCPQGHNCHDTWMSPWAGAQRPGGEDGRGPAFPRPEQTPPVETGCRLRPG